MAAYAHSVLTVSRRSLATAVASALVGLATSLVPAATPVPRAAVTGTTTVVAAGDIACRPPVNLGLRSCSQGRTADLIESLRPEAVLMLGDSQYQSATVAEYNAPGAYVQTWGRPGILARTIPVAGNHEWETRGAAGYRSVFDARTGGRFYHSRDLSNGWHVIGLDSDCAEVGGCTAASPQGRWLAADLAANDRKPTIVLWHHPRWSSGSHGDNPATQPLWSAAVGDPDVQVVLNGHDHDYERMHRTGPYGAVTTTGARMFVVGTGGAGLVQPAGARDERSAFLSAAAHGVLRLTLRPDGYSWRFAVARGVLSDSGSSPLRPRT